MAFKISTGLQSHLMVTDDLAIAFNGMTTVIKIYGSPTSEAVAKSQIPSAANDTYIVGDNALLCTVSVNGAGTGLTFDTSPVNGAVYKTASESWYGLNSSTGYPAFYRIGALSDADAATTTLIRGQGTVGQISSDLIIASLLLTATEEQRIDNYLIGMPLE